MRVQLRPLAIGSGTTEFGKWNERVAVQSHHVVIVPVTKYIVSARPESFILDGCYPWGGIRNFCDGLTMQASSIKVR